LKILQKINVNELDVYMPTELFENILAHADGSTKDALLASCTRVYNLKKSQVYIAIFFCYFLTSAESCTGDLEETR
jgi:hypothetical protein